MIKGMVLAMPPFPWSRATCAEPSNHGIESDKDWNLDNFKNLKTDNKDDDLDVDVGVHHVHKDDDLDEDVGLHHVHCLLLVGSQVSSMTEDPKPESFAVK